MFGESEALSAGPNLSYHGKVSKINVVVLEWTFLFREKMLSLIQDRNIGELVLSELQAITRMFLQHTVLGTKLAVV